MKSRALLCTIAFMLMAAVGGTSSASFGAVRGVPTDKEVAAYIQPLIDDGTYVGIVVGIVGPDGRRAFSFGSVRRDQSLKPSGETVFALASITKTFTGVLLADLVSRGVVRLDDPVTKFLPPGIIR